MSESKAMILGIGGTRLSAEETAFFRDQRPWGFILFARNIADRTQLRDLVDALRQTSGRADTPILIDQEGGRVQRLRPPLASEYPPAAVLGRLYGRDRHAGRRAVWLMSRLHAFDLTGYGINVDCLPVLDLPAKEAHDVIGDRAYAEDAATVAELGRAAMQGLMAGGVLPVIKHVPGHGRATADSHHELPVVDAPIDQLRGKDFVPFKELNDAPMAMSAHIVYSGIDSANPATTSSKVVSDIIRGEIGFDGLLMTDDLSMKALSGDFGQRASASLAAGCDLVLHCNGDMNEMRAVAEKTSKLSGRAAQRAGKALTQLKQPDEAVEEQLREEFTRLTSAMA